MKKSLPIGISDFKEMIDNNYYYVDKTLFIKEIIDSGAKVNLLPRPRRFGKTLNLSMLKYYFEKSPEAKADLFEGLAIREETGHYQSEYGKYPVIFLTFKDCKVDHWQGTLQSIKKIVKEEYERHKYLMESDVLASYEKETYQDILTMKADDLFYTSGLKDLSNYLYRYYGEKVIILIDEYDAPIQSGYLNGFYDKIINFMRNFLSGGLKDNIALKKGILSGILRIAKESIFSGLNNLSVYNILNSKYNKYFGLLEDETYSLLNYYGYQEKLAEVTEWYNGYNFGGNTVYNPWSIIKYIESGCTPEPHWVNTSGNELVRSVIIGAESGVKKDLEKLINLNSVEKQVYQHITFGEIEENSSSIFSFLLFSGYLKVNSTRREAGRIYCELMIPNNEVKYIYEEIILKWLSLNIGDDKLDMMLEALTCGDIETFELIFQEFILNSMSYFDTGGDNSEKIYHAFVLGLLVYLNQDYQIKSNRESGYGRYDVMLIPRDKSKSGVIIEFKKVNQRNNETLEDGVEKALKQIEDKQYRQELLDCGVREVIELGIAFLNKEVIVKKR